MIRALVYLAVLAACAAGAVWLADLPGAVTLQWQDGRIDTSPAVFAFAIALLAGALALLLLLISGVRRAPGHWRRSRQARRRERGYRALTQGMVAVAAGDAEEAHRQSRRADSLLHDPPLTMLLSAQAAQLGGDTAAARRYFTAMLDQPETAFLGLRGLLMQAERDGDRDEARRLIERAYALRPDTPWVLDALIAERTREERWRDALATTERAAKLRALPAPESRERQAALLVAMAEQARDAGDGVEARSLARKANKLAPAFLPASIVRAELLASDGRRRAARRVIDAAWVQTPHPDLARIAASLEDGDALARERAVERLVASNPDHRESRIARAEAALAAKLWGIARAALAPLASDNPSAHVCRLMARLEAEEKGDTAAERAWLLRAATAAPDPSWLCESCGAQAAAWTAKCPHCGEFARLTWAAPDAPHPAASLTVAEPAIIDAPARGA
jgi:HemY protein